MGYNILYSVNDCRLTRTFTLKYNIIVIFLVSFCDFGCIPINTCNYNIQNGEQCTYELCVYTTQYICITV